MGWNHHLENGAAWNFHFVGAWIFGDPENFQGTTTQSFRSNQMLMDEIRHTKNF